MCVSPGEYAAENREQDEEDKDHGRDRGVQNANEEARCEPEEEEGDQVTETRSDWGCDIVCSVFVRFELKRMRVEGRTRIKPKTTT